MDDYWNYTVEAYGDCVTVKRNIDNTISRVYIDVDGFATREWNSEAVEDPNGRKPKVRIDGEWAKPKGNVEWMGESGEPEYMEYGKGAFAKFKFDVSDGVATFAGVNVDDWDEDGYNFPTWLRLLAPARHMVENVPGIERCEDPQAGMAEQLQIGEETTIEGL